ncbi:ATP-dependent Clp protease proteolytic subunit-related protein 2, chloroplastic-like isoform X2 [Camellia sinensis]|uniref:ATP-dependent Clp protease proteolytic subunit-related protein 2, chloroplastic-like isoform X2 n=1 Tax=Camellia sinensis TaxID=4442 RepID=UPI0010360332|nr:ATP-dependent Clp protease proteolytic subunit-related protein 2, chloroplastic-like isoform X2 [Camellia sinensis]
MAVSLHTTSSTSCLHSRSGVPQPSPSCTTKVFMGLKLQSPSSFGIAKPNSNVEFHNKVHKSIQSRTCDSKPTRARIGMMPIGTPRVPYRTPGEGTWQWVDLWNALYRERVIFIGQHIDEKFSNQILVTMLYLDSIDSSKRMYMYINGPGGDLTPSMAVYDTMQSLKSPVGTHCVGYAYNLAGFLVAAGEKGNRFAMPLSRIALQSPAGAARGQADDIRNEANELLRIRDYLFNELPNKTGQPAEKYWYCEHSKLLRPSNKEGFPRFIKWNLGKMYSKWKHISLAHFEKVNQSALTPTEQEIQLLHINQSTSTDSSEKKHDHKKDNKRKKKTKATKKKTSKQ